MFWINFEWLVFTRPHSLEDDGDTIKMNDFTLYLWRSMPEKYRGMAIVIQVVQEN